MKAQERHSQALLLKEELGGVAPAVLSGALGFIAAEAATLWGGAFFMDEKTGWRPTFTEVDGQQVDYAWIDDSEVGFSAEKLAEIRKGSKHKQNSACADLPKVVS